jgi:putative endonuclease
MERRTTCSVGRDGERRAAAFLMQNGYEIVESNFRTRGGEIDIIALGGDTLVFAEVKALPSGALDTLARELDRIKQQKIIKTAKLYLQKHREYSNRYIRFDVLAIDVPGLEPVYHIVNAFSE